MRVVSEAVAKTKFCPLARARNSDDWHPCMGSDCLAWASVERPEDWRTSLEKYKEPHGKCEAF